MSTPLTAEALLAGAATSHVVELPATLIAADAPGTVELRPLTLRDVQRIRAAAKAERVLTSVLMVQQALVAPKLSVDQVSRLKAGVVQHLLERVNAISGLSMDEEGLDAAVKAPLARACFVLAREFGWTPAECSALTVGQVLLYLEMLARDTREEIA